ncbi:MAG: CRISPR-associated endonuclease Cas4g/Cas1g [bacterium JZ-2024 1]
MPENMPTSDLAEQEFLPVSLLAEVAYCPRNFYYRAVEGEEPENVHILRGELEEERRNERERITRDEGIHIRSIKISSEKLGWVAVVDALVQGEHSFPLEYKSGSLKESLRDDVQLCAQAMLLEEHTGKSIPYGYIYYSSSRSRRKVEFTQELRQKTLEFSRQAMEILHSEEIPPPVADERCSGCALLSICLPFEVSSLKEKKEPPERIIPRIQSGKILYVDEQGAFLTKKGGEVIVSKSIPGEKKSEILRKVPAAYLDQIILVGNITISTQLLRYLMRANVDIVYFSTHGKYEGRFVPSLQKNAIARKCQFHALFDQDSSLRFARGFILGKLHNCRTILMRHLRARKEKIQQSQEEVQTPEISTALEEACQTLQSLINRIPNVTRIEELLGIEGAGASAYFKVFGMLIKQETLQNSSQTQSTAQKWSFHFEKRTRRPPADPVNALLSFGYALLLSDMVSALTIAGLDPYAGFYHKERYGRPNLALDLMEEFRPIVVDSLVLAGINKSVFSPSDFEQKMFGGIYLAESGRKKFFRLYAQKILTEIEHPLFGYKATYRRIFEVQARLLAKVLQKELEEYVPFTVR